MPAFTLMMVVVMIAVAGMAVREIRVFARKRDAYPLRRLTLRVSMAAMLIILLGSVLVGVRVFHLDSPSGVVGLWMAFWGCIAMLAGAVVCLAIADLRSIDDHTDSNVNLLWRDIAMTIAEHEQQQHEQRPDTTTDDRTDRS